MAEDVFWVHTEPAVGARRNWHGPFRTQQRAEQEAEERTAPFTGTEEFAEVVCGQPGARGRCVCEYFQGGRHHSGGSTWHSHRSPDEMEIPTFCLSE